jgi:hypothetical protein
MELENNYRVDQLFLKPFRKLYVFLNSQRIPSQIESIWEKNSNLE